MKKLLCAILAAVTLFSMSGCGLFGGGGKETEKVLEEFVVKFDPNGGELVSGKLKQHVTEGDDAKAPEVEREGYEFDGWDKSFKDVSEDLKVKAKWKKYHEITFKFEEAGKEEIVRVLDGETPEAPTEVPEGFELEGWEPEIAAADGDTVYTAKLKRVKMSAEKLYEFASPCVAEILVSDSDKEPFARGSGFFLDGEGLMVTNYHVMEGAYYATATTLDGDTYDVLYVVDYDKDLDIALIKVDVTGNSFLTMSDDEPVTGEKVYTIGSSLGLSGTLSDGIISTASRIVDGLPYIQITAPISHGNSGGPLIDEYGRVLGINTWNYVDGQNLNFAVPVHQVDKLSRNGQIMMADFGYATAPYVSTSDLTSGGFFDTTDPEYWEVEFNDTIELSDTLEESGMYAAVIASDDDIDVFRIHAEAAADVCVKIVPLYKNDCGKLSFFVCDKEVEEVYADEESAIIGEENPDNGNKTDNMHFCFPSGGDYYLAVYNAGVAETPFYYGVIWYYEG